MATEGVQAAHGVTLAVDHGLGLKRAVGLLILAALFFFFGF